ncbi:MAG: glycosyltransferase family 1 protein, partial [Thermoanaerobaculia bacterium]|nr:glycosyltransferase family 1 protein [Thermoanaerobaculia bacterium]
MRIALVTETFPPEVNGVARTLWQLVLGLARRGHQVEVYRPDQKAREGECPAEGWRDVLMAGVPIPVYEGLRFGLPAPRKLLRRWREEVTRPDVVHIATEGPLGLSALWAARRLDIPVSTTFHTNFHDYGRFYGMGALRRLGVAYLRWFHNRADCTLVPARDVRRRLEEDGFLRVGILSRGVDTELFRPDRRDAELRHSWGAGPNDLVVVFVSRLAEEKNPQLAAAAFAEVKRVVPDSRCVAVGDGPAREHMKELVPDLILCGMRRGPDLAAHYASADLFLFPSLTETFG